MRKRRIKLRPLAAPVTEFMGFAIISFGVATFEGATPIAAIPVVILAATVKTFFAKAHRKVFRGK